MKFLENQTLASITQHLTDGVYGSRVINGRVEEFSCKRVGNEKKYASSLDERYDAEIEISNAKLEKSKKASPEFKNNQNYLSRSPLGNFNEIGTRKLLTDLILALNSSFPDYDFSSVKADDFEHKASPQSAMEEANQRLSEFALATKGPDFLPDVWNSIDCVIKLSDCEVFSYAPSDVATDFFSTLTEGSENECSEQALWSFNYFFVNKSRKKIVAFTCVESYLVENEVSDEEEVENEATFEMDIDIEFDMAITAI